jgi:hypothetical protein
MYYILKKYLELCPNAVIWLANGAPVDESYEINQGLKAIRSEKVSAKYQENIQKLYDSKFRDEPRVQFFDMCRHALQLVGKGNTSHDGMTTLMDLFFSILTSDRTPLQQFYSGKTKGPILEGCRETQSVHL